jgi:hypothetical protein
MMSSPRRRGAPATGDAFARAALVTATIFAHACQDLPEPRYETKNVRVATYFDHPVCMGSLAQIDGLAVDIKRELEIDVGSRATVYWGVDGVAAHCEDWGTFHPEGCYDDDTSRAFAGWGAIQHELAHAFADYTGDADTAFEEGLAIALSTHVSLEEDFSRTPHLYLGFSSREFNTMPGARLTMGHFVRWLRETRSVEPLLSMRRGLDEDASADEIMAVFEEAFGASMLTLEEEWREHAPEAYDAVGTLPSSLLEWADGRTRLSATLDCEAENTLGPLTSPPFDDARDESAGMWTGTTISITDPGAYSISVTGADPGGALLKRQGCWVVLDDSALGFEFIAGEASVVTLSACSWELYFWTESYDRTELTIDLERLVP